MNHEQDFLQRKAHQRALGACWRALQIGGAVPPGDGRLFDALSGV